METHSSGPWWPAPLGPNSTAGTPASRNEPASEAPSRPTLSDSPLVSRAATSQSAMTYGFERDTKAGLRMNVRGISMSGIVRICSRMSPGSWFGR